MSSAEAPVAAQTEPTAVAQEETVAQQTEETPVSTEEAPAAPVESTIAIIEQGHLFKRGPAPLRLWQKRLFVLPAEGRPSYTLNNLRQVYRKNVKKSGAPKEEFVKANQYLLHTLATATVNASYILAYYKNDSSKDIPNGFINLGLATSVAAAPKIRPNAFVIKTKARDYVLSASTASETESWIKTLNEFVNADLPDYSDSEAYKQSYNDLGNFSYGKSLYLY
ncbi:hypothetical protein CONCODRAFT_127608 [Conidiobolus coronatus NRRL 28638]|uniref:PH domain-containing protein n=1 Tax=Conidiobolus coronatus (strain ATCC 28846 / CBS 209.66 / NRRL 28638) TaxID=796925 RepID=A0A137PIL4_CONC2|nr:hypothetical protein CONCODRAFT_127608 [Conidiobolus coronatus NRRL 28638]|eukprot:KXN74829.1 hypothetical protein CONCODRAFT_127608 [Conidiobolus coronatus NRRL 28638]